MFKTINNGILPKRFSKYSAGFDVCSNEDIVIGAGETKLIGLGIAIDLGNWYSYLSKISPAVFNKMVISKDEIIEKHYLELHIRSSLRARGLTSLGTGIIDIDFADEIKMVVHNPYKFGKIFAKWSSDIMIDGIDNIPFEINKGDKIGQIILKRHEGYLLPQEYTIQN